MLKDLVTPIGVGVAVYALIYNNRQAGFRDRRKELRSVIDGIVKSIQEIESNGLKFHTAASYDAAVADGILRSFTRMSASVQRLELYKAYTPVLDAINAFKQALTLNNFDPSSFATQLHSSDIPKEIFATAQDLIELIEQRYTDIYPL
ncbi:hypothetical protein Deipe_1225 [Deinococcus peraridilitoris DSM 19664]|uniref:Uncharacterized protein n=2 Tax=Deinococcus TaxID=1298 RepID=K9ZYQ2_DEIPD|nr:hypothetical protein Deipe_1225 [Deinococcus peraridilitoris DSM 19664]